MRLAAKWDELVADVRELDGFKDFLGPPSLESLQPAADGGPVVVLNISPWRCDALIVTTAGVRMVELGALTLERTLEWTGIYLSTLEKAEQAAYEHQLALAREQSDPRPSTIRGRKNAASAAIEAYKAVDVMLRSLQEWLWDTIAAPVFDELGLDREPPEGGEWPRLWWCPTGPLTMLPLHSAGYHGVTGGGVSVIDRVVSSYTPTLRALVRARENRLGRAGDTARHAPDGHTDERPGEPDRDRLLIVTVDEAPGQARLDAIAQVRDTLTELMPQGRWTALSSDEATWERVHQELPKHRWVHFSCHGGQDLGRPSQGGLILRDRTLRISDISERRFHGEFAGLAACKTATGGLRLLDEAITLSAALHYTGYRHVVAALWSILEKTAVRVFDAVYRDIVVDGALQPAGSALALHNALRRVRTDNPDQPGLWTPFTHTGP
ncbi:CHAT domain-containing protein [Streptomyces sp. NBC_00481]|uniref:CHAT domain-containing protein n=1 Tax=unclassified Streptomyces TaxID=2593676 RepID=UPI002DDABE90|nr:MULTISPECIES: CHAT domain-containing protein [unclassified Streptomyces]WRY98350.1 CHAT domain-containing protein [Streptomyces sp. NBC_00481]